MRGVSPAKVSWVSRVSRVSRVPRVSISRSLGAGRSTSRRGGPGAVQCSAVQCTAVQRSVCLIPVVAVVADTTVEAAQLLRNPLIHRRCFSGGRHQTIAFRPQHI
jgi:hypothetical protein